MTLNRLYVAQNLGSLAKDLDNDKGFWKAIVDKVDVEFSESWKDKVSCTTEIEREMFKEMGGDENLRKEIVGWIKKWPNIPVLDGRTIKQLLAYENTSLWWFGETVIFKDSFRIYHSIKEIFTRLEVLRYFIKKHGINEIHTSGKGGLSVKCIITLGESMKIPCIKQRSVSNTINTFDPELIYRFKRSRRIIRGIISRINRQNFSNPSSVRPRVLAMSYFKCIRDDVSVKLEEEREPTNFPKDMMLYSVFKSILKKYGEPPRVIYIDRGILLRVESIKNICEPAFPLDLYVNLIDFELLRCRNEFKRIWVKLKKSSEFRASLEFKGVNIWPLLKDYLAFLFIKQFPEAVEYIRTMGSLLTMEQPKALLILNETGFYGRALVVAAKKKKIKTLGLQHGNIAYLELEHYHVGEGEDFPCPIPDITAIGGESDRAVLLKNGLYNDNKMVITGRPRYDSLANVDNLYEQNAVRKRYDIKQEKIVLISTARSPIIAERELFLKAMIKASRELNDVFFLVKPHPFETISMHEKIIGEFGHDNVRLVGKEVDTKELLYTSDLNVNVGSTVGLESILMGVPFMLVNLTGRDIIVPYLDYGATISITSEQAIVPGIQKALNREFPEDLEKNMERFINDFAYKVDGQASDRVVNEIEKLIKHVSP